jgi:hypothetical protein
MSQLLPMVTPVLMFVFAPMVVFGPMSELGTDQLGSNVFAFNPTTGLWTFQLGTGPFTAAGTYRVSAQPGEASYTINPGCSGEFVRLQ